MMKKDYIKKYGEEAYKKVSKRNIEWGKRNPEKVKEVLKNGDWQTRKK